MQYSVVATEEKINTESNQSINQSNCYYCADFGAITFDVTPTSSAPFTITLRASNPSNSNLETIERRVRLGKF